MSKEKGGMRSAKMPSDHFEKNQGNLSDQCKLKYATEMGNPADLDKSTAGLANFVKKNKMKY